MADETDRPDNVSSMMEELWGPRGEAPAVDIARPRRGAPATPPHAEGRARSQVEALRADVDAVLAALVEKLAGVRDDAVAAADARVAGAETRLLSRLDEIAVGVAQAVERSAVGHDVLARLDVVEREAVERWVALEGRVGAELRRVVQTIEDAKAEPEGIERRITEAVDNLADRLRARQSELRAALEARVEQLQAAVDRQAAQAEAAVDRADQVATTLKTQRREIQALRKGLAKVDGPLTMTEAGDAKRLQVLEEHAKQTDYEMSELGELHGALDVGLGSLLSEMAALRDAVRKMTADEAELFDRAEGAAPSPSTGRMDQWRTRRTGPKG